MSKSTRVIWEKNHINGEFFCKTEEIPGSVGPLLRSCFRVLGYRRVVWAIDRRSSVRAMDRWSSNNSVPVPIWWEPRPDRRYFDLSRAVTNRRRRGADTAGRRVGGGG